MNRLLKPFNLAAGIFFLVFLVGISSNELFSRHYARESLSRDTELMLYLFQDAVLDAEAALDELPSAQDLNCSQQFENELAYDVFRHPAVRWIGIEWPDGRRCYSDPSHINTEIYNAHEINENYALASSTDDLGGTDILVLKRRNGIEYIAALNPFMYEFMAEFACTNCLEFQVEISAQPVLSFAQNPFEGQVAVSSEAKLSSGDLDATLSMSGNREFYNYYRSQGTITAILLSLAGASLSSLGAYSVMQRRQSLNRLIEDAIAAKEFFPFYQGIVDSGTGEVLGAEVLVRWIKPDGTVVPPYQFIAVAEDTGLIVPITSLLIERVAADLAALGWNDGSRFASINIVPDHLKDEALIEALKSHSAKQGIALESFAIEITERKKIDDLKQAKQSIDKYHNLGVDVKLDDAGTGYGGFSYVQELGIRTLKIDKMFVDTILISEDAKQKVLDAIIEFARSSGLATIAEGVENEEQVAYLAERGVTAIQGYVYCKPVAIDDFAKWLEQRSS